MWKPAITSFLFVATAHAQVYSLFDTEGTANFGLLGQSVSGMGDVNSDGVPDLAAGLPGIDRARAISGRDNTTIYGVIAAPGEDDFGWSVAGIGDVTGDGVGDLVVGAPKLGNGFVRVCDGLSGATVTTLVGPSVGSKFGSACAGSGDVNNDGIPDLIIGAPFASRALIYSGANWAVLADKSAPSPGELFGSAVAGMGDIDADGFADYGVGSPNAKIGVFNSAGRAQVWSGKLGLTLAVVTGTNHTQLVGTCLVATGDINGDGWTDIMVGGADPATYSGVGGALLYPLQKLSGFGTGYSAASIGDVDFDGVADFISGRPDSTSPLGCLVYSAKTGVVHAKATLQSTDVAFGTALAGIGDVNGDGVPDFAIGDPDGDAPPFLGFSQGRVRVATTAGVPPSSTYTGHGCLGAGSTNPTLLLGGGVPSSNGSPGFTVLLKTPQPAGFGVLVIGTSFLSWQGIPLPLDLAPFSMPGCTLYTSADFLKLAPIIQGPTVSGVTGVPLPIPASPSISGSIWGFQWLVPDAAPTAIPGAMSRAFQLVLF